jgi:glycosyltransferase involved in cell wall biosynthesis
MPPGQPDKLAQSMLRMLTDGELRNRVIAAGKQRIVRQFDNRQLIQELAEVYREGMGKRA